MAKALTKKEKEEKALRELIESFRVLYIMVHNGQAVDEDFILAVGDLTTKLTTFVEQFRTGFDKKLPKVAKDFYFFVDGDFKTYLQELLASGSPGLPKPTVSAELAAFLELPSPALEPRSRSRRRKQESGATAAKAATAATRTRTGTGARKRVRKLRAEEEEDDLDSDDALDPGTRKLLEKIQAQEAQVHAEVEAVKAQIAATVAGTVDRTHAGKRGSQGSGFGSLSNSAVAIARAQFPVETGGSVSIEPGSLEALLATEKFAEFANANIPNGYFLFDVFNFTSESTGASHQVYVSAIQAFMTEFPDGDPTDAQLRAVADRERRAKYPVDDDGKYKKVFSRNEVRKRLFEELKATREAVRLLKPVLEQFARRA
jgi:hypothetical protein